MAKRDRSAYWRERSERRRQDPEYREKQAKWNKDWLEKKGNTPERRAKKAEQMRSYGDNPETAERRKARSLVRKEINSGRLIRLPCEVCGTLPTHAHHDDYSKPLDVRWLCPKHHREHHAKATA